MKLLLIAGILGSYIYNPYTLYRSNLLPASIQRAIGKTYTNNHESYVRLTSHTIIHRAFANNCTWYLGCFHQFKVSMPQSNKIDPYREQINTFVTAVEEILDPGTTKKLHMYQQSIERCNLIQEKNPALFAIFQEQFKNPDLWVFVDKITTLDDNKLPLAMVEKRKAIVSTIENMSGMEKIRLLISLSKKF